MGAWIEIARLFSARSMFGVAPLVGAWIEITLDGNVFLWRRVAPLVGAWIEIEYTNAVATARKTSLPSWERGLKL